MPLNKIAVVIADDHRLIRSGIKELLSSFSRVDPIYEAANCREILELISTNPVDVVLLGVTAWSWLANNKDDL